MYISLNAIKCNDLKVAGLGEKFIIEIGEQIVESGFEFYQ